MHLTKVLNVSLSTASLAGKKAKADRIIVLCRSVVTEHFRFKARSRLGDKLEFVDLDPVVGREVLYREEKKIRSIREHQIQTVPRIIYTNNIHSKWRSICPDPSAL